MEKEDILIRFLKRENFNYKINEPMHLHTSMHVGGNCKIYVMPKDYEQLKKLFSLINKYSYPFFILGNGTNLIVKDSGYDGVIINLMLMDDGIYKDGNMVYCPAGFSLFDLNKFCKDNELSGLEFSFGIPGSVGGAIYMNAGAYGHEIGEFIEEITVFNGQELKVIKKENLCFEYRNSNIHDIIISGVFKLEKGSFNEISTMQLDYYLKRRVSQPLEYPSSGSVFKKAGDIIPAQIIDKLGLKGVKIGGAEISCKHAGFIINRKSATAADVLELIYYIKNQCKEKLDIELIEEVIVLG